MSVNVVEAGPFERVLEFSVSESDIDSAKGAAARKLSRDMKIRGFRPGKAPRPIVEATVGAERLRSEAIDELLPLKVTEILAQLELEPATPPELADMDDSDDGIDVKVKVTLWPAIETVPEHEGRRIVVGPVEVTDEEIEQQIDRIREQFAEVEDVDRVAENGDYVTIDISATSDGEDVPEARAEQIMYEVGSDGFIEGADDGLVGAAKGAIVTFDAPLPAGFGERAGQEMTFSITVGDIKQKVLPDLTDEWVADTTEFSSVAELEVNLEEQMGKMKREALARRLREQALDELVEEVEIELPESLVRSEMDVVLHRFVHRLEEQGISLDDYFQVANIERDVFIDDLRNQADRSLKTRVLLDAVAERAGIEVTREEIDFMIEAAAMQSEQPEQIRRALREEAREKSLVGDILRNKALEAIVSGAVAVDEDGNEVDLRVEDASTAVEEQEDVVPVGVPVAESERGFGEVVAAEVVEAEIPEDAGNPAPETDVDPADQAGEIEEE